MGGAGFPPCWLFGLRWPNTGAYPGSLVELMADSGRAHAKQYFPELLLPVSLSLGEPQLPPASAGDPPTLAGRSGLDVHTTLCVSSKSGVSVSPVLPNSCNQIPLPSKSDSLGIPPPVVRPPGWEAWCGAQNLHSSRWLLWCKCSPVCEPPTQQLWDLILLW